MNELEKQILNAMNTPSFPMHTVYRVCRVMGNPQNSSTDKYYARVYRHMEKLVDAGLLQVVRGVRDRSVYISTAVIK